MNNCVIPQKIANDIFVRHENGGKTTIHSNKLGLKFGPVKIYAQIYLQAPAE